MMATSLAGTAKLPGALALRPARAQPARAVSVRAATHHESNAVKLGRRSSLLLLPAAVLAVCNSGRAQAGECPDLTNTSTGIQYCELTEGTGATPVAGALIRAHYTGKLTNGAVFDSSYERGRPLSFKVGVHNVIPGWDLGILGDGKDLPPMKEGGKRRLVIPPELAYGDRGAGGVIPPGATLDFLVELLPPRRR